MEQTKVTPVHHERFKDALWYDHPLSITIGGAGGIGSWLTFFLNRVGHTIFLYDFDTVEQVNLAGQLYGPNQVGKTKIAATTDVNMFLTGEQRINEMGKFGPDGTTLVTDVVMMGFDNMLARRQMAEAWFEYQKSKPIRDPNGINILIDGRMDIESGHVFIIKSPADYERYMRDDMPDDSEVPDLPCTHKATSHNGARMAQEMMNVLNNYIVNRTKGMIYRKVPYRINYELPTIGVEIID